MKAFTCDICGGALAMDGSGAMAVCEYCGIRYPKERLQAKIQEIKGTVTIEGTVKVAGISTKQKLLDNAETYLDLGQYARAETAYGELIEKHPEEAAGWWGLYKLTIELFKNGEKDFYQVAQAEQYAAAARKLKDIGQEYDALWSEIYELYGKKDIIDATAELIWDKVTEDAVSIMTLPPSKHTSKNIQKLQNIVTAKYVRAFRAGKVSFFRLSRYDSYTSEWFWDGKDCSGCDGGYNSFPALKSLFAEGIENAKKITPDGNYTFVCRLKEHGVCIFGYGYRSDNSFLGTCIRDKGEYNHFNHLDEPVRIVFHLGNTLGIERMDNDGGTYPGYHILILDRAYTTEEINVLCDGRWEFTKIHEAYAYFRDLSKEEIQAEILTQRAKQQWRQSKKWKAEGRCPRCGGEMKKSFLGRKCTSLDCCGRSFGI